MEMRASIFVGTWRCWSVVCIHRVSPGVIMGTPTEFGVWSVEKVEPSARFRKHWIQGGSASRCVRYFEGRRVKMRGFAVGVYIYEIIFEHLFILWASDTGACFAGTSLSGDDTSIMNAFTPMNAMPERCTNSSPKPRRGFHYSTGCNPV